MVRTKKIVIIGTLDTKAEEIEYIRNQAKLRAFDTIVIDVGVLGQPLIEADIKREEVAKAGGMDLSELVKGAEAGVDKETAVRIMMNGVTKIVQDLHSTRKLDAVIAVGGAIGTAIGTAAMRALPYGVPKLMLSIILTHRLKQFVDSKDIAIMNYPTDILGLNFLTRKVLSNAGAAIAGMLTYEEPLRKPKRLIGLTSLGVTTPAVLMAKKLIEELEYETITYTINTEGLDDLLTTGLVDGILDLTPCELIDAYITKSSNNVDRLSTAYETGIPQVIAPGGLDFIILPCPINNVPKKYKRRKLYKHSPYVTLVRTNKRENVLLGRVIAEKANKAKGLTTIAIPLRGFSAVDKKGQPFYDQSTDKFFADSVKKNVLPHVKVLEIDAHINDEAFVKEVVEALLKQKIHALGKAQEI
jgi:uncharacterized protein (UPF0261 family)